MRANNKNRLTSIEERLPTGNADWQTAAVRRLLPLLLHDPDYANLARKPHIVGTSPADAARFEAEATAHLVKLCRQHGEHRYADYIESEAD